MADDNDTSGEFGRKFGAQPAASEFIKVKAAMRGVGNSSNGWMIVFDPDHEEERGREPMINPADYKRFLADGLIEPLGSDAPGAQTGSDRLFVPSGLPRTFSAADLEELGVPQVFLDRLAAMNDAENGVDVTTGSSTKGLVAFPQDVGHDLDNGMGDDAPPAPVKRGRPPKPVPVEPVVDGDGKPVVPTAS